MVENRKVDNCPRDNVLDAEMRLIVELITWKEII